MAFYGKAREVPRRRSTRHGIIDTEFVTLYHVCLLILVHEVTSQGGSISVNSTIPIKTDFQTIPSQSPLSSDPSFQSEVPLLVYSSPETTLTTQNPVVSITSDAQSVSQVSDSVKTSSIIRTTEEPLALIPNLSESSIGTSAEPQKQSTRFDDVVVSSTSPDFDGNLPRISTAFVPREIPGTSTSSDPNIFSSQTTTNSTTISTLTSSRLTQEGHYNSSTFGFVVPVEDKTVSPSIPTERSRPLWASSPVAVPFTQDKTDVSKDFSTRKDNLIPQDRSPNFIFSSTSNNDVIALVSDADNELPISPDFISSDILFASSPVSRSSPTADESLQEPTLSDQSTRPTETPTGFEDVEVSSTEFRPELALMTQTEDDSVHLPPSLPADPSTTPETPTAFPVEISSTSDATFDVSTTYQDILVEDFGSTTEREPLSEDNDTLHVETHTHSNQREPEPFKQYENLTPEESINSVTVMFAAPSDTDIYWNTERNRIFRTFVAEAVNEFIANQDEKSEWVNPEHLVYVHPSPLPEERILYVVFFIRNFSSQNSSELIPAGTIVSALRDQRDQLQQQMGMNVTFITNGIIMVRWNESPFFVRHAIVFISLLAVAFFCIIVIMIALIYIRCRNSRGRWDKGEYGDKKKLKKDMKITREIGDLQSERQIRDEEKVAGHGGYLNGNGSHVVALEDEGWVIPFDEVITSQQQQQRRNDSEDTKL